MTPPRGPKRVGEEPVRVVCDECGLEQWNTNGHEDEPAGCVGCGHTYGTYAEV